MTTSRLRVRSLLAALVVTVGLFVALVPATANAAGPDRAVSERARIYYGAIARSTYDGAVGVSTNYGTYAGAVQRALNECRARSARPAQCRMVVWRSNGCGALAENPARGRYGVGHAPTRARAQNIARYYAGGGSIRAWFCTAGYR